LKIEPQKNLTQLKTAAEYPIWKFRWIHMMKVYRVPPSFYTDEDPHYVVPTRPVYDIDSGLSFEEKLVPDEMESYLFSLLLTNLDNKWIHLVTGVLDGNFRQAWFKIQAQFDGNSRRSRRTRKTAFFNLELHEGTSFTQFADSIREAGATLNRVLKRDFLNEEDLIDALFMGLTKHEAFSVNIAVLDRSMKDGKHFTFDDCVEDLKTVAVDLEKAQGNIAWKQVRVPNEELKKKDCWYWLSSLSTCDRGKTCLFNHDPKKKGVGGTPQNWKPKVKAQSDNNHNWRTSDRLKTKPSCGNPSCKDENDHKHDTHQAHKVDHSKDKDLTLKQELESMRKQMDAMTAAHWGMGECEASANMATHQDLTRIDDFWGEPIETPSDNYPDNYQPISELGLVTTHKDKFEKAKSVTVHHAAVSASHQRSTIIDSGATTHITGKRGNLIEGTITPCHVSVGVAKGEVVTAHEKGTWRLTSEFKGKKCDALFKDTLLLIGVSHDLVSVPKLAALGHHFRGQGNYFEILHGEELVVGGIVGKVGLYDVKVLRDESAVAVPARSYTQGISLIDLWHRRLGHASEPYLRKLLKLPAAKLSPCDACYATTTTTLPFSHQFQMLPETWRILQEICGDICGPLPTRSMQGSIYFAILVDLFSRMKWILFLRLKSEFAPKYILWHTFIVAHTGHRIQYYHSDGGGAVSTSQELIDFHKKMGTKATSNTAHQHNQNPVPERQIALVMKKVRAMLKQSGAPKWFWQYAAAYYVYVSNRTPTRSNNWRVPITCFGGKPSRGDFLKYCRIFGSLANVHIPKENRVSKFSDTSFKGAYLGMDEVKKGGIYYNPVTKKVVISRNAYHNETVFVFLTSPVGAIHVEPKIDFTSPADFYNMARRDTRTPPVLDMDATRTPPVLDLDATRTPPVLNMDATRTPPELDTRSTRSPPPPLERERDIDVSLPDSPHDQPSIGNLSNPSPGPVGHQLGEPRASRRSWQPSGQALRNLAYVIEVLEEEEWELAALAALEDQNCPNTYQQAVARPDAPHWIKAMKTHLGKHDHKGTFEIAEGLPYGKRALSCRWVFTIKYNKDNSVAQYKARLVVKGFQQKPGVDFKETFATVAHLKSLRVLLAICAAKNLKPSQLDVGSAFLNAPLEEEVYMLFPPGFPGKAGQVIRLRRAIFGLRQGPRQWFKTFQPVLLRLGFKPTVLDSCVFVHSSGETYLLIHVDDAITATNDEALRAKVLQVLRSEFESISSTDEAKQFVGMDIDVRPNGIHVSQKAYLERMIARFNMEGSSPVPTPANEPLSKEMSPKNETERAEMQNIPYLQLVGALLWASRGTRLDIAQAVISMARFSKDPGHLHWSAGKRILRYLNATMDFGLFFKRGTGDEVSVEGYGDANWGPKFELRYSRSGGVILINGVPVIWFSKTQKTIATSTCEAEFMAQVEVIKELLWLKNLLTELGVKIKLPIPMYCDNRAAKALLKNPVNHEASKHIDIKSKFIAYHVSDGWMDPRDVGTDNNLADIFTKVVSPPTHRRLVPKMMTRHQHVIQGGRRNEE
jgi:hypothetical protein